MLELISDRAKYEEIGESIFKYTLRIEDKINNFLRKLKKSSILSENVFRSLLSTGTAPGILYGLPKIHKPDFSTKFQFRPIFAAYNCPSFKIAKYQGPDTQKHLSSTYLSAVHVTTVRPLTSLRAYSQNSA